MFRNMNSSLIISIGISIILCGAIVYYCNTRLNNVETAIMRQNQVLSSFIANMQNELRGGSLRGGRIQEDVSSEDVSTPEARESAAKQSKIVVSDDEDDDDDSSSESDTDDDDDTENENKIIINKDVNVDNAIKEITLNDIINSNNSNDTHYIKIVDVTDLSMFVEELQHNSDTNMQSQSQSTIYEIEDDDESSESESDDEHPLNVINLGEATIKIEKVDKVEEQTTQTPLKIDQMRVDDLRKMVIEKNLSTKDEVKKLKKPELLFLLQQQPNL
jgi:hypothetical protein